MQYRHATLLLFIILIGTSILTVAVYERRQALKSEEYFIGESVEDDNEMLQQEVAMDQEVVYLNTRELTPTQYRSLDVDLDGDGTAEHVALVLGGNTEVGITATIAVNNASDTIAGIDGQPDGYFGIVDIDSSDNLKEIAVGFGGHDVHQNTVFYHWHDGALVKFGTKDLTVGGWEDSALSGDGLVSIMTRAMVLDTWFYNAQYRLDGDRLVEVPQTFYTRLDQTNLVTALTPQNFQTSPTNPTISMTLAEGEEAAVLGCNHIESVPNQATWCQMKDAAGNTGWFNADTINMEEDFFGFSFAD